MNENDVSAQAEGLELLSFTLGGEDYAIDIGSTQEIRGWTPPSSVPCDLPYVLGVINLRGEVLPLVNLAARLNLEVDEVGARNVIIVAEVEDVQIGLLVDAVSDIIAPSDHEMKPPLELTGDEETTFVSALTFVGEKIVKILNLSSVLPTRAQLARCGEPELL